ncbi:MAG: alkaline phosphatase family protein [Chloroflexota bacterium]|nr:alkaline phosphatase family protein [Chloroflexota bacterium]
MFPSVTRINAASMVTGVTPGLHGLAGNSFVARDYDATRVISALNTEMASIAKTGLRVLNATTLQEILSPHDMNYVALGVGTSGNAYAHNPLAETHGGATIHPEFTIPSAIQDYIENTFGEWPAETLPNLPRYERAMNIFLEYVLGDISPEIALIWSSEPDKSQHMYGVGAEESNQALRESDEQFGRLVQFIKSHSMEDETNLMIVSDHGYSTIIDSVDLENQLEGAGFILGSRNGEVLVAPNGGSALLYVGNSDSGVSERLVEWITSQSWCGTVLTSDRVGKIEGTLPLSLIGCDGPRSPDITVSFKWTSDSNENGFPGFVFSTGGIGGQGQHGSMSRYEMNNTLICSGPAFKTGARLISPTGNIDVMPTALDLLGLPVPANISGRILKEGYCQYNDPVVANSENHVASRTLEVDGKETTYTQEIAISKVGSSVYLDEGNGCRDSDL